MFTYFIWSIYNCTNEFSRTFEIKQMSQNVCQRNVIYFSRIILQKCFILHVFRLQMFYCMLHFSLLDTIYFLLFWKVVTFVMPAVYTFMQRSCTFFYVFPMEFNLRILNLNMNQNFTGPTKQYFCERTHWRGNILTFFLR